MGNHHWRRRRRRQSSDDAGAARGLKRNHGRIGGWNSDKGCAVRNLEERGVAAVKIEGELAGACSRRESLHFKVARGRIQQLHIGECVEEIEFDLLRAIGRGAAGSVRR